MKSRGFTLIELIFVIVIIGVLSAVAIPKFAHLVDNAKISSELATASSVQSAIDAVHGEWITNTCDFDWGNGQKYSSSSSSTNFKDYGYPTAAEMGTISNPFVNLLKNAENGDWNTMTTNCPTGLTCYQGPASLKGNSNHKVSNKPNKDEWWEYNATKGEFKLHDIP